MSTHLQNLFKVIALCCVVMTDCHLCGTVAFRMRSLLIYVFIEADASSLVKRTSPNCASRRCTQYRFQLEACECGMLVFDPDHDMQAIATRKALANIPFQACFSSPISRARECTELIWGDRDPPVIYDDALREAYLGYLQGMANSEAAEKHPEVYGVQLLVLGSNLGYRTTQLRCFCAADRDSIAATACLTCYHKGLVI